MREEKEALVLRTTIVGHTDVHIRDLPFADVSVSKGQDFFGSLHFDRHK